ncbi:hypothetical protein MUK42_14606 [Musa troglodytarum]|uniref:Uncharacterized protein n=1 Tax=Musa troglodytarum TaxID=320322 RepID=A0A9E7HSA3_9LILI|nr:hypothetical protein MUK42_14606 [Musa troglodytarum]
MRAHTCLRKVFTQLDPVTRSCPRHITHSRSHISQGTWSATPPRTRRRRIAHVPLVPQRSPRVRVVASTTFCVPKFAHPRRLRIQVVVLDVGMRESSLVHIRGIQLICHGTPTLPCSIGVFKASNTTRSRKQRLLYASPIERGREQKRREGRGDGGWTGLGVADGGASGAGGSLVSTTTGYQAEVRSHGQRKYRLVDLMMARGYV